MNGLPVVNINGTEAGDLIDQRMDVVVAIERAIKALREASPHGRDYQTAPPGSMNVAMATYRTRLRMLEKMRDEIQNEAMAIDMQRRKPK